ncbi:MAG: hypothetical protein JSS66_15455 [Armatimonadetes bacterium]|nr:hypothetical protein [Armatimonadota bacterium]
MPTRREFLADSSRAVAAISAMPCFRLGVSDRIVSADDLELLKELSLKTLATATKQESVAKLGFPVVTPGGAYPALWIRDFSMAVGSGMLGADQIQKHLRLIAQSQNGAKSRTLKSGGVIPPFAIPDHVNYDGGPVFYPGTYSSGEDQGGEPWGVLPPVDDHYEFVHIAHTLWRIKKSASFLFEEIGCMTLIERLEKAIDAPTTDPKTGLVVTTEAARAVGFGFCDGIVLTGSLLFPSLLRHRALGETQALCKAAKRPFLWAGEREAIRANLIPTFQRDGWLMAATGIGRQPDVWGTAFAVHSGVVTGAARWKAVAALVEAVKKGTITYKGAVRHVPTDLDFSADTAWEKTVGIPRNRYQNGAYWHVPTGWLVSAISSSEPKLARALLKDMIDHVTSEGQLGAPWECLHPDGDYRQNPVYLASVTLPYEVLRGLR